MDASRTVTTCLREFACRLSPLLGDRAQYELFYVTAMAHSSNRTSALRRLRGYSCFKALRLRTHR